MAAAMAHAVLHKLLPYGGEEAASPRGAFVLLAVSLMLLLIRRFSTTSKKDYDEKDDERLLSRLPSPPNKLPVLGHMHLMGPLPHVSLAALAAKNGPDLMLLRLGSVPTVVASSPRAAEAILRTHDHVFASRPRSMVADIILYGASDSCYAPYGAHFRKVRKLVTLHLLSSKKVQSYRHDREEEVAMVMEKLDGAAAACAVVDMSEVLQSFTNDLICRAVSGKFFRDEGRNKMFRELIDANAALLGGFNLEDYFPKLARLKPVRKIICAKVIGINRRWDQLLNKLIADHVTRLQLLQASGTDDAEQEEDSGFIDVLLSLQEEYGLTTDHIKAIVISMFEAGTETSYLMYQYSTIRMTDNDGRPVIGRRRTPIVTKWTFVCPLHHENGKNMSSGPSSLVA
ncbi:hypothetical protein QOZ80_8AG0615300 [Eleusine coracana subsp. coracana]|nr:hypothetical protein QOZ80_8AG0615300 [Eleusine coracana subsp. coracana]